MRNTALIVMAKEPIPGFVKTRLHPPLTYDEAAVLAAASLEDTTAAVSRVDADRVLCVKGELGSVDGFRQIPQGSGDLDSRIGDVFDAVEGDALLIGMDTPQVDPLLLERLVRDWPDAVDAWFGPATDGGFWLLGLRSTARLAARLPPGTTRGDLVRGVPMSRDDTGAVQRERLVAAGLVVQDVAPLTDIDDAVDLLQVMADLPDGSAVRAVLRELRAANPSLDQELLRVETQQRTAAERTAGAPGV